MNVHAWIAGSLLALVAIQPVRSETQRHPQEPQNEAPTEQPLRRAVAEEAQLRREPVRTPKLGRLSPEERLRLRQDVNAAGRDIYRRPAPGRY